MAAARTPSRWIAVVQSLVLLVALETGAACSVKIEAPDAPIRIDIRIVIEQQVLIKVDQALDDMFEDQADIFGLPSEPE